MANRIAEYDQNPPQIMALRLRLPAPPAAGLKDHARRLARQASQWIAEHPQAAVAAAMTIGVIVGWVVKRGRGSGLFRE